MTTEVEIVDPHEIEQMEFGKSDEGENFEEGEDLESQEISEEEVKSDGMERSDDVEMSKRKVFEMVENQLAQDREEKEKTRRLNERIHRERKIRDSLAFSDYCRVVQSKVQRERQRDLRGSLDESTCVSTNQTYYEVQNEVSEFRKQEYGERRNFEVKSLYQNLGCEARVTQSNCYGSYRDIAVGAYERRKDWTTTQVTGWLNGLAPSQNWGGTLAPYTELLPYLPVRAHSYLDFGCGSGNGMSQVSKYLGQPNIRHGYDIKNNLKSENGKHLKFISEVTEQYDLVTMVNVMHHVKDLRQVLAEAMNAVKPGQLLILKDHFVDSSNVALAVLVHEMYEPTCDHDVPEELFFRELRVIQDYIRYQGWSVEVKEIPYSNIGDVILVCRNSKDNGLSQIVNLENQVQDLTQKVYDLTQMVSQHFNNPKYQVDQMSKKKVRRPILKNNDLALPSEDRGFQNNMKPRKVRRDLPLDTKYPTGKKGKEIKVKNPPVREVTTVWRPKGSESVVPLKKKVELPSESVGTDSPLMGRVSEQPDEIRQQLILKPQIRKKKMKKKEQMLTNEDENYGIILRGREVEIEEMCVQQTQYIVACQTNGNLFGDSSGKVDD